MSNAITDDIRAVMTIFMPYALERMTAVEANGTRFVHYSSAEAAYLLVNNAEMWLKKPECMNDFSEIRHGIDCLLSALQSGLGSRMEALLEDTHPGLIRDIDQTLLDWLPRFHADTYLGCLSEHGDPDGTVDEDRHGRLSMWRAYGGASGVAIVIKSSALLLSYEGLGVYSSPVAYLDAAGFKTKLAEVLDGWEAAKDILKQYSRDELLWRVMNMFRFAVLSTKHPGFVEEREWRLIHSPQIEGVGKHMLKPCIKTIRGVPQPVRRLPLDGSEGAEGIKLSSIIDLVVIGPTQFPQVIREAFIDALTRRGVEDPSSKIVVSGIPLRT